MVEAPREDEVRYVAWVLASGRDDPWLTALVRLIDQADPWQRQRLRRAFPEVVGAYEAWLDAWLEYNARACMQGRPILRLADSTCGG